MTGDLGGGGGGGGTTQPPTPTYLYISVYWDGRLRIILMTSDCYSSFLFPRDTHAQAHLNELID